MTSTVRACVTNWRSETQRQQKQPKGFKKGM